MSYQASKLIKTYFFIASIAIIFSSSFVYANTKFLSLPFNKEPKLMQGWNYNFGSSRHQGIDYYADIGTDLVASADGKATKYYQGFPSNYAYGNFVIIDHENGFKTLYAHLSEVNPKITKGTAVKRGEFIGKSGITGTDNPHLHYESLSITDNKKGINAGYGWRQDPYDLYKTAEYYPPNKNYKGLGSNHLWMGDYPNLPPKSPELTATYANQKVNLSWTKIETNQLDKIEIYRSSIQNGTADPAKRTTIFTSQNQETLATSDQGLSPGTYFYALYFYYKNGLTGISEEKSISIIREFINITNNKYYQDNPRFYRDKLFWEDCRLNDKGKFPKNVYYYDLKEGVTKSISYNGVNAKCAYDISVAGKHLVFTSYKDPFNEYLNRDLYAINLETGNSYVVYSGPNYQSATAVNETGFAVWQDLRAGSHWDIYAVELEKAEGDYLFAGGSGHQLYPKINGNFVAFKDNSRDSKQWDILMKEIGYNAVYMLEQNTGEGTFGFWGDYISWDINGKIFLKNIKTGEKTLVNTGTASDNITSINEGKLVYAIWESGKAFVHVYDIAAKTDTKLDFPSDYYPTFDVSANYVAIMHITEGNPTDREIYLAPL